MMGLLLVFVSHALFIGVTAAVFGGIAVFYTSSMLSGFFVWVVIVGCGYLHASRAGGLFSKLSELQ